MKKGDFLWAFGVIAFLLVFVLPKTNDAMVKLISHYPYILGFVKFAILASMGELLANRILSKEWKKPAGFFYKMMFWGCLGVLATLMFQLYPAGIEAIVSKESLFHFEGWSRRCIIAFLASVTMNLTFAPVFMAAHRISDCYIESRVRLEKKSISEILYEVDWAEFIKTVVFKSILFFWIPVHTVTLLLPAEYRVLFAAFLSIVLGAILSFAKKRSHVTKTK